MGSKPLTYFNLVIDNDKCIGGIIVDYYDECKTLMPVYMAIDKEYRCKGLGTKLLSMSYENNPNINHCFIECDDRM